MIMKLAGKTTERFDLSQQTVDVAGYFKEAVTAAAVSGQR